MNNNFKKIALLCTALAMNITTYTISTGGAVAAGFGAAAGVGLLAYGISKSHKNRKNQKNNNEEQSTSSHTFKREKKETQVSPTGSTKKQLKHDIHVNKKELREHKLALKKLERKNKGSTPEAQDHRIMITKLENLDADLNQKLKNL